MHSDNFLFELSAVLYGLMVLGHSMIWFNCIAYKQKNDNNKPVPIPIPTCPTAKYRPPTMKANDRTLTNMGRISGIIPQWMETSVLKLTIIFSVPTKPLVVWGGRCLKIKDTLMYQAHCLLPNSCSPASSWDMTYIHTAGISKHCRFTSNIVFAKSTDWISNASVSPPRPWIPN